MNCSDFLSRFTDYRDGVLPEAEVEAVESHLRDCDTCGRYHDVLERGSDLLRALPEPELRADFVPRLRHRLYHVDDERALAAHQSGAPALTVLGIAIILTALAWAPVLRGAGGDLVLEPIVVDRVPDRSHLRPALLAPPGTFSTSTPSEIPSELFENTLLYDYSALSQRYNQRARVRRVAEYGR
jgi:anti-sigma factor RsiW